MKMEEAIISNCRCHWETQRTGDEDDATPRFVTDLLKNRITALENKLSKKDFPELSWSTHWWYPSKPDFIIIHAGTNDLATIINPLNNLRKILKKCTELFSKIRLAFSNVIVRKDKVNLERIRKDIHSRMKNFCQQKRIDYIDNSNNTENHLGMKKLYLNGKGNTAFAKNLINFIENWNEN